MTLLYDWLKVAAKSRGNNKALVYRDNYLSWRGLLHRVDRRAQEFKSMGIGKGAWVGLMLGNVPDFVILAMALSKLESTVIPIDPTTGARELDLMVAATPLRALITRPRGSDATSGQNNDEESEEETPEIRRRLQGTLLTCSVYKREQPKFDFDPVTIMYTADSLGDPKAVLRSHENLESMADTLVEELKITKDSKILVAVPLFLAYGWDLGLMPTLRVGATMFLEEEISSVRVGKLIRDHTIDVFPGTPLMFGELSKLPTAKPVKSENPRFVAGSASLNTEVAEAMKEGYEVNLIHCYHSTETGVITLDLPGKNPGTVGKTVKNAEIKFSKAPGSKSTSTKQGCIWVKGPGVSTVSLGPFESEGIVHKDIPVGGFDKDGWYRSGDLGKLDRSSRLSLTGREDDVVKVEGKRVALGQVEGCLESFPKIKEAQARLESDPWVGSTLVAKVVADSKCEQKEVIDHCAKNLAPYKVPRRIEFCKSL